MGEGAVGKRELEGPGGAEGSWGMGVTPPLGAFPQALPLLSQYHAITNGETFQRRKIFWNLL